MGGKANFQPVHISKLCPENRPVESPLDARIQRLNELFDQEPWVIQHHIYENYNERAVYLNRMMEDARASFERLSLERSNIRE